MCCPLTLSICQYSVLGRIDVVNAQCELSGMSAAAHIQTGAIVANSTLYQLWRWHSNRTMHMDVCSGGVQKLQSVPVFDAY